MPFETRRAGALGGDRKLQEPAKWALAAGLFLVVLGARWVWIDRFGMALPYMDQWDAEARTLFVPWFHGERSPALFVHPHNEHRIALTRALALALTLVDRQWDQRLECVINAALAAGLAAVLLALVARRSGRGWAAAWAGFLAVLFGTPAAWENTVRGFDSQQYFLLGLSAAAIAGAALSRRAGIGWLAVLACLVLALGSMASGMLAAIPVGGIIWARMRAEPRLRRRGFAALAVCAAVLVIGATTQVHVSGHDPLRAQSAAEFLRTFVGDLGWPASFHGAGAAGVLLWLPLVLLAARAWRGGSDRRTDDGWNAWTFGLGGWALLQVAAMAYARSGGSTPPATRYLDLLCIGLIANGFALVTLLREATFRNFVRRVAGLWLLLLVGGLAAEERSAWSYLTATDFADENRYEEANVRHYVATGNPAFLNHNEIPYPNPVILAALLDEPAIRQRLPSSVRTPLPLATAESSGFGAVATPPFEQTAVHGGRCVDRGMPAVWRSTVARGGLGGWLVFPVIGELGTPGTELALRDAATGAVLTTARPQRPPGATWHSVQVPAPRGPFVVAASCRPGAWFAFGDPVEMGGLSHWAARAARRGGMVSLAGAAILAAGLFWPAGPQVRRRGPASDRAGKNDISPARASS